MDKSPTDTIDHSSISSASGSKMALIGFVLMLIGPAMLFLSGYIPWILPKAIAYTIMWIMIVLPATGAVLSIVSLRLCKKEKRSVHPLSVITLVMCNPLFYFLYFFICGIMGDTLAGIPWM